MRARFLVSSLLAACLVCAPANAQSDPARVSQRLLDDLAAVSGVPGMGAAIWQRDRIAWTGSTGYRDLAGKRPVDDKTVFRLASVSKLLAATAVAKLHEQGKLDVDAPVTAALPWLKNDWAPMTARQLAAHTSGLFHYQEADQGRGATPYPDSRSAVAIFAQRPLLQAPGAAYSYSSWGYTLLGAMVEESSGLPFAEYVAREVAPGLKIGRDATDGPDENASVAYEFVDRNPKRAARHDFSYSWAGGGMSATPSAIASFAGRMLRNEIVSAQTFAWMLQPAKLNDGREVEDDGYRVGFGWRTMPDEDKHPTAFHSGIALGARSTLVMWPEQDMAVSLMSNALWTASIDRTARMIAAPHRPAPEGLVATACPVKAVRYVGMFGGQPVAGAAQIARDKGMCTGRIEATGDLKTWLSGGSQAGASELRLVGLDQAGGLARAGLITPFGIYDWRASADGSFKVPFGATRELVIRLH